MNTDNHLVPMLGHHRLDRLRPGHIKEAMNAITDSAEAIAAVAIATGRAGRRNRSDGADGEVAVFTGDGTVSLRIGVGRPAKGRKIGGFALGKFSEAEHQQFPALLEDCATSLVILIASGLDRAHTAPQATTC